MPVYLGNGVTLGTGDTLPSRYLPVSLLTDGDFYLDEFAGQFRSAAVHAIRKVGEHWVSDYPVGAALVAVPVYAPFLLCGVGSDPAGAAFLEKLSASLLVALSALVIMLALRRLTTPTASWVIAIIYGLCTSSLSVSSQALWQHGPSQLALAIMFFCLLRGELRARDVAWAGFAASVAVICRPTDVLLVAPIALFLLIHHTRSLPVFVFAAIPAAAFQVWYDATYLGTFPYSRFVGSGDGAWSTPLLTGLAGLLVSPGRGLFSYSPILVLSLVGFWRVWSTSPDAAHAHLPLRYASVGVAAVLILYSKWWNWWGGQCYGPRLLADILPPLCLALYPLADLIARRRLLRHLACGLALVSFLAHLGGVYWEDGRWNGYAIPAGLWNWSDNPLVNPTRVLATRVVIALRGLPTSVSSPGPIRAGYYTGDSSSAEAGPPVDQLRFSFTAVNEGESVWMAWPRKGMGTVFLEWVLRTAKPDNREVSRGRVPLRHDVLPGGSYDFPITLLLPRDLGTYVLNAGIKANGESAPGGVEEQGLRFEVSVRRAGRAGRRATVQPS